MKKKLKTREIHAIYAIISKAKYGKMDDADKIKVYKITRALKSIATKYEEDNTEAAEKFKPSEDFSDKWQKAQEYERLTHEHQPTIDIMTTAEYDAFIEEYKKYNKLVADAVKEYGEKEVSVDITPISEDAFAKLMNSNDWTMGEVATLGDFIIG